MAPWLRAALAGKMRAQRFRVLVVVVNRRGGANTVGLEHQHVQGIPEVVFLIFKASRLDHQVSEGCERVLGCDAGIVADDDAMARAMGATDIKARPLRLLTAPADSHLRDARIPVRADRPGWGARPPRFEWIPQVRTHVPKALEFLGEIDAGDDLRLGNALYRGSRASAEGFACRADTLSETTCVLGASNAVPLHVVETRAS